MTIEIAIAAVIVIALIIYALSAGADFGGGVWSLFAFGKRAKQQRKLIEDAIAPIWETNHVWLILVIVLLFICFPKAFTSIVIALHIPLTLMLIGIVLRGSAFIFCSYGSKQNQQLYHFWQKVFGISSILTPLTFGMIVAAVASGKINVDAQMHKNYSDFFAAWWGIYPLFVGTFTICVFTFLAAVYLICEAKDHEIQEDFRKKALYTSFVLGVNAFLCLYLSQEHAPILWKGLYEGPYAFIFHIITGCLATSTIYLLYIRKYKWARGLAVLQIVCIVIGWSFSQFPYIIVPHLTFANSAAPKNVLYTVFYILIAGMIVMFPSLFYLYRIFKKETIK